MSRLNVDDGESCSGTSWLFALDEDRSLYIEVQRYKRGPLRVNAVTASGAPSGDSLVRWEANIGLRWETVRNTLGDERWS